MTAVPSWDPAGPTDADLARAAASGDRGAFASIYDRYADRLHGFSVGILRDRDAAADCVQDAFCIAATRLTQLREPDNLRPWLYAIVRNEALRRLRERRRETPSDEMPDTMSDAPGPDTLAARTELADLIAEATGGLSDRDRAVLELAYWHGLDGPELADALGVSASNANKMVYRLRDTIERSLGALLVSRRARNTPDGCPELAALLDGWDGRFSVLMRKRIGRHIESCPTCDEQRQQLVSPAALIGSVPVFVPAPAWLRERTLGDVRLDSLSTPITGELVSSGSVNGSVSGILGSAGDRLKPLLPVVLFVAALIASLSLTIAWLYQLNTPIIPTKVNDTDFSTPASPVPSNQTPIRSSAEVATTVPATVTPPTPATPPVHPPDSPEPPPLAPPELPPLAPPEPPPFAPPELPPLAPPPDPGPPVWVNPPLPPPPVEPPLVVQEPPPQAPERTSVTPRLDLTSESPSLTGPIMPRQPVPSINPPH